MDLSDEDVADLPIDSDINLEIPMFPIGLTISDSFSLKNMDRVEKPTKPPVSPRQNSDGVAQPSALLTNGSHENSLIKLVSPRERNGKISPRNSKHVLLQREKPLFETRTKGKLLSPRELRSPSPLKSNFGKKMTAKDEKSLRSPQGRRSQISPVHTPKTSDKRTPDTEGISPIPNGITVIKEEADIPFEDAMNFADMDRSDPSFFLSAIDRKVNKAVENGLNRKPHYTSINDLKAARDNISKCMEGINGKLNNMKEHKAILCFISSQMKESSHAALELKRNNQGVPFVNAVKDLVKRVHDKFNNDLNKKRFSKITADQVPFVALINDIMKTFGKICQRISLTTVNYNVTFLEDFHLMAGKLHAMIELILILYYQDASDDHCSYEKTEEPVPTENSSNDDTDVAFNTMFSSVLNLLTAQHIIDVNLEKRNSLKFLEKLGKVLSRSNESLENIARLSLGNPKNQSLYDAFASVTTILKESDDILAKLTELKTPCVPMLRDGISRAMQISKESKPGEKQVEELKFALGVCDGSLLILAKHIQ